jgi:uncharacterized membrane protein YeaQ/YmgE (transglycosylase-associated protein family)
MKRPGVFAMVLMVFGSSPAFAQSDVVAGSDAGIDLLIGLTAFVIVGSVTGWLAGRITGGTGKDFRADMSLGIGGALFAGYVATEMGFWAGEVVEGLLAASIGALVAILIARLVRRAALVGTSGWSSGDPDLRGPSYRRHWF